MVLGGIALASVLQLLNLKQQLADKQAAVLALTSQNDGLQERVDALEAERRSAEERLETLKNQLIAKTGEIDQLRRATSDLQAKYDVFQFEKDRLTEQVTRLTQERDEATSRVLAMESEKRELEQAASRFRERFALLDRDYQDVAARLAELERGGQGGSGIQPMVRARMDPSVSESSGASSPRRVSVIAGTPQAVTTRAEGSKTASAASDSPSSVNVTVSAVTPEPGPSLGSGIANSSMAQTIELPPIVVRKDEAVSPHAIRSRVVETNRAHHFIILDKGAQDGVLTGMTFEVQRGGVKVAHVTAVRVRPQLSACEVAPSAADSPFPQVGDVAVQRSP